jgi:hypothetical protein
MTGFGQIRLLPGIWESLHIDTAVTLPVGVEAYAAFALRVWLTSSPTVSDRTRRFARWSAIAALVLGMAGQVAYHLLSQARMTRAPWEVTTLVSCLPVLVLGMGSALAHLLRSDAASITGHQDEQIAAAWTARQRVAAAGARWSAPVTEGPGSEVQPQVLDLDVSEACDEADGWPESCWPCVAGDRAADFCDA